MFSLFVTICEILIVEMCMTLTLTLTLNLEMGHDQICQWKGQMRRYICWQ